jgi:hypothetical protein
MAEQPQVSPQTNTSIQRLNLQIAEMVKALEPHDIAELLTGHASSLIRADDNQNQNQNGGRAQRSALQQ